MPAHSDHAQPPSAAAAPIGTGFTLPAPQTVAQIVEGIFTRFDADSNGSITLAELLAVLDPASTHAATDTRVAAALALIDSNGDSSLSKAEITAAVSKLDTNGDGSIDRSDHDRSTAGDTTTDAIRLLIDDHGLRDNHPAPVAPTISQVVDDLFTKFDANADKSITLTELLSGLDPDAKHDDLTTLVTALVKQVDTNADGSLSAAELTAAMTQLDVNGNGTIDGPELAPHPAAGNTATVDLLGLLVHFVEAPPAHGA